MHIYAIENDRHIQATIAEVIDGTGREVTWFGSERAFFDACEGLMPGCLVIDICALNSHYVDVQARPIRKCLEKFEVIFLSGPCDVCDAVAAMRAGAIDFFELPFRRAEFLDAIARAQIKLEENAAQRREDAKNLQLFGVLTPRELSVLQASSRGESSKIAAHGLGLSPRTVEMHRSRITRKLEVPTFAAALVMADRAQLLREGENGNSRDFAK